MTSDQDFRVVVVGAGGAARMLTKSLRGRKRGSQKVHITIVQPTTFVSIPHYQTLVLTERLSLTKNSTFQTVRGANETIYGVATACSDGILAVHPLDPTTGAVQTKEIIEVPFDIIVAATGAKTPIITETPGQSFQQRQEEIDAFSRAVLSGKHVVVAGGGAIGVELAGDILECLPVGSREGKVTLISSTDRLIADQAPAQSKKCLEVLESLGGNVLFGERVVSHSDTVVADSPDGEITLELKSGKTLQCYAYVAAFGRGANTSWLTTPYSKGNPLPSNIANSRGQVVVNEYLQCSVYDKLFAIAATNDRKQPSLTMVVQDQATTVAANIAKPNSKALPDTPTGPVYQAIGSESYGIFVPENLPMPAFMSTVICEWCGFPFNLFCPCWLPLVLCGPMDPLACGYCCGPPHGEGLANSRESLRKLGTAAFFVGYQSMGERPLPVIEMDRE
eukprot:Nitzschia sp. Nitz4//scaffold130_size63480//33083//34429//NITZ4_006251-RA/size63480-processed-gene-0.91-mRNA-1//-1//CDS//3329535195//14//frame0